MAIPRRDTQPQRDTQPRRQPRARAPQSNARAMSSRVWDVARGVAVPPYVAAYKARAGAPPRGATRVTCWPSDKQLVLCDMGGLTTGDVRALVSRGRHAASPGLPPVAGAHRSACCAPIRPPAPQAAQGRERFRDAVVELRAATRAFQDSHDGARPCPGTIKMLARAAGRDADELEGKTLAEGYAYSKELLPNGLQARRRERGARSPSRRGSAPPLTPHAPAPQVDTFTILHEVIWGYTYDQVKHMCKDEGRAMVAHLLADT
jgi:hypothetical protein